MNKQNRTYYSLNIVLDRLETLKYAIGLLVVCMLLFSCNEKVSNEATFEKYLVKPGDVGEYHKLKKDNIKIFLPEGFKPLTADEIKVYYDKIEDDKLRYYYEQTLAQRKNMVGNFYNFYGNDYATEVSLRTLPYMPFSKQNAKELIYLIRKGNEKFQAVSGIYHNKITSTYSGSSSLQIFKAKYRLSYFDEVDKEKQDYEMFRTIYLITSNNKTFSVSILSPFNEDFDPFIRKFKL